MKNKVGVGYDIHRLVRGRKLILGGVEIPHGRGSLGHSDGDCLVHALIDALLGALGQGDIGQLFPDTDPGWKDIRSTELLEDVVDLLKDRGATIQNVDAVIAAERPRLGPHVNAMKQTLAPILGVPEGSVGIKAKTNEGLGAVGRGRAIACWAVALISQ